MSELFYIEVIFTALAFGLLFVYHIRHFFQMKQEIPVTDIGRNNQVRAEWVRMIVEERRDILAVQTLRNWTMAATFLASTAILIGLGVLNLTLSTEKMTEVSGLNMFGSHHIVLWATKLLVLALAFFFAFFNFTLAVRYYNHVGFMINVPAESDVKPSHDAVSKTLNRGAMHYHFGMRAYYISIPLTLWLLGPTWLLLSSLVVTVALYRLDRPI